MPPEYNYYAPFILQLWYTPLLPLAALIARFSLVDTSVIYSVFLLMPLFIILYYLTAAHFPFSNNPTRSLPENE
jgi:hypothetical protein